MKNEKATQKTTSALLKIARQHFTQYGYWDVSLEKIAEEGKVTRGAVYHHFKNKKGLFLAVLDQVQKDVAAQIEGAATKSEDPWQQLLLGCVGFITAANAKECRRVLLVDAPAVVGWDAWRKADRESSVNVLQRHIDDLKAQNFLDADVDTQLMTYCISGALNELALHGLSRDAPDSNGTICVTISKLVDGFRKSV